MKGMDKLGKIRVGKNIELRAQIIHADGSVEDHGIIAAHYSNPFKQLWWLIRHPRNGRIHF